MKTEFYNLKSKIKWVFFFSLLTSILLLVVPIYSLQLFDRVLNSFSLDTLYLLTFIACWLVIVYGFLDFSRQRLVSALAQEWHLYACGKLIDKVDTQNEKAVFLKDIKHIETGLRDYLSPVSELPWTSLFLFVLYIIHPTFFSISFVTILILVALSLVNLKFSMTKGESKEASVIESSFINNHDYWAASGLITKIASSWKGLSTNAASTQYEYKNKLISVSLFSKTYRLLIQIAITAIGVYYVLNQALSVGGLIAANLIVAKALAPFEQAVLQLQHWVLSYQSWKRFKNSDLLQEELREVDLPLPQGSLLMQGLVVRHDGERNSLFLKGLNNEFKSSTVIIGANGSGKSTLLKVLSGELRHDAGEIRLAGNSFSDWSHACRQKVLGIYHNNIPLLPGSILDNMTADFDSNEAAIKLSQFFGLHEKIMLHELGYQTPIDTVLSSLSESELQLILFIRAVVQDPHVLIADNIDDNLDTKAEVAIRKYIDLRDSQGKVTIYTAKKMNLIAQAKKALYIESGSIKFSGPTQEFIQQRIKPKEVTHG